MPKNKMCTCCKKTKDVCEFYRSKSTKDGFHCYCKPCNLSFSKKWRMENPEKCNDNRERWLKENTDKYVEYKKRWSKENPTKYTQRRKNWFAKYKKENPEGFRARDRLNMAVRYGKIKRQPCVKCGKSENIHGHHPDYSKPLDVVWLCASCHKKEHVNAKKR